MLLNVFLCLLHALLLSRAPISSFPTGPRFCIRGSGLSMVASSFRGGPKQPSRSWGLLFAMLLLFDASSASNFAWSPLSTHVMPSAGLLSLTTLMTTLLPARAQTRRRSLCNMHGIYNATIRRCECAMGWTGGSCDEKVRMIF